MDQKKICSHRVLSGSKKIAAFATAVSMVSSIMPLSVWAAPEGQNDVTVNSQLNCTVTAPAYSTGDSVTITVTANNGYEPAKLNVNGTTVQLTANADDQKVATYTISNAPAEIKLDAWADPATGKLSMTALTEKPEIETIANFGTLPAAWSDGYTVGRTDFKSYPGMAIFDAEAGNGNQGDRYKIDSIIAYSGQDMPGRAHFKVFGTNEELSADMFTANDGANSGSSKLTALTHDNNDAFFGTGAWDNNKGGGTDAVRGEYAVNGDKSYRYIIIQSDHKNMMALSELKIYGSVRDAEHPDPTPEPTASPTAEPDKGAEIAVNTELNCTVAVPNEYYVGADVTITITANEGYEPAKLNVNGKTVQIAAGANNRVATYTISNAPAEIKLDAWADPATGKLSMTALTEKPEIETIANFGTLPAAWSDGYTVGRTDFKSYPGMAIFDAEAGNGNQGDRYKIDRIIAYSGQDMPGRAHFKVFGTNEELTDDMFTTANGANSGSSKLTVLTHGNNNVFFGTGSYDNNKGGGTDAVRGEYEVNGDKSYRYIIIQSDHKNMMALSELKIYGSVRDAEHPDPTPEPTAEPTAEPDKSTDITIDTESNCTVAVPDWYYVGGSVTITVTADNGYEPAKLNINGKTIQLQNNGDGTATGTLSNAPEAITVKAWADPTANKISLDSFVTSEQLPGVSALGTLPARWSDGDVTTSADFKAAPGLAILDAGEGNRYALSKVISYARQDMNGRAHFKILATNAAPLTADMFTDANGANGGLVFTALTHDSNNEFFGTGSWDNNKGGGIDAVRGEYDIESTRGYRYIVIQSDHKSMMSLGELKLYGTVRSEDDPNEPEPEDGTATIKTHAHCTISSISDFKEGDSVTINVTAADGYEFSKLNLNNHTVKCDVSNDRKTATYTLSYAPKNLTVDAWAEAKSGKLEMTSLTEKPSALTTVSRFSAAPAQWSDNDATTVGSIDKYPGMVIYDAGENSKYALSRVITYADANYPGRAHLKIFGTNEDLTADMFTEADGANSGSDKLDVLSNDEGDFYGTGSYTGNGGGNGDAVRQYYDVQSTKGYRYIIVQSDNTTALSLAELKFYGEVRAKNDPDPVDPSTIEDPRLLTYKAPTTGVEMSKTYKVEARPAGDSSAVWRPLDVYAVQVMSNGTRQASMTYFDCTGDTEIRVTCTGKGGGIDDIENGLNSSTAIYPASYGIRLNYEEGGNVITFTMKPGQRVVLDPNDDSRRDLHIWADKPIDILDLDTVSNNKTPDGKTVTIVDAANGDTIDESYNTDIVYVKPGFYSNGDGYRNIYVKSNQTWYFEPGAVINGTFNMDYTINAKLIGHGLMYRPSAASMTINDAKNTYVQGMMGLNHGWRDNGGYFINVANSKNVYVKDLKSIGRHKWGDTMDIFCSEDVTVEGCYYRGNDDCIAIYGPRWTGNYWGETGNVRNIKVRNCVLMPDVARPIHFGTHGDSSSPNGGRVIDNCSFENIDILTYCKYAAGPQAIQLDCSEGNMITNIYFNDIRIQDGRANNLCNLFITVQGRYGTTVFNGRGINNIYFKDVQYTNKNGWGGRIDGSVNHYNYAYTQNVTFENLVVNGEVAHSAEDAHLNLGGSSEGRVRNIRFVESGEAEYQYDPRIVPEDIWPELYDYARESGANATGDNGTNAAAAIDGNKNTSWDSGVSTASAVYNGTDKTVTGEGITIDLGKQRLINAVRLTWADPSLKHDYRIFVSEDGVDWSKGHTDEHGVGAVNSKARAEYNLPVKTTWFANQYDYKAGDAGKWIVGRYVKIIPQKDTKLDIASAEILGYLSPDKDAETTTPDLNPAEPEQNIPTEYSTMPMEIKTAADLAEFAAAVNAGNDYAGKTVVLANDIDLSELYNAENGKSWSPIGYQDKDGNVINAFAGVFEGGNHSITGLYINNETGREQGLFGIVSGTVKNLTVEGEINASSSVGGIAGWNYGKILNCTSNVDITARREAGGIAGTLGNNARIEDCTNEGDVTVTNKETYAGGIVGHNNRGLVLDCTNSGKVENGAAGEEDAFRNKIGGIVGYLYSGKVEGCDNSGEVVSNETVASYTTNATDNYVGGIVGYSEGGTVTYCENTGRVHNAVNYAGGVAGYLQSWDNVLYSDNSGQVSSGSYTGGIVGYNKSNVAVCDNTGKVVGDTFAGGVAGYLSLGVLNNCTYSNNDNLDIVGVNDFGTIITDEDEKPAQPPVTEKTPNETAAVATPTVAPTASPAPIPENAIDVKAQPSNVTTKTSIAANADGGKRDAAYATDNKSVWYVGTYDLAKIKSIEMKLGLVGQYTDGELTSMPQVKLAYMSVDKDTVIDSDYITANSDTIRNANHMVALVEGVTEPSADKTKGHQYLGASYFVTENGVTVDSEGYAEFPGGTATLGENSAALNNSKTSGEVALFVYATAQSRRAVIDYIIVTEKTAEEMMPTATPEATEEPTAKPTEAPTEAPTAKPTETPARTLQDVIDAGEVVDTDFNGESATVEAGDTVTITGAIKNGTLTSDGNFTVMVNDSKIKAKSVKFDKNGKISSLSAGASMSTKKTEGTYDKGEFVTKNIKSSDETVTFKINDKQLTGKLKGTFNGDVIFGVFITDIPNSEDITIE